MLDLDKYINNSMKVRMFGEVYDILEPTIGMNIQVNAIESDLNVDNLHEKRMETALLLLNHNKQEKIFTENELKQIPFEALSVLLGEIALFRLKAETDPNSDSQSPKGK